MIKKINYKKLKNIDIIFKFEYSFYKNKLKIHINLYYYILLTFEY